MNMHAMNMQLTVAVGVDWTLHPWRHNSSNVGGVTAGQVGHNCNVSKESIPQNFKQHIDQCYLLLSSQTF